MWSWLCCLIALTPFAILPLLWVTFPESCSNGHIYYAPDYNGDGTPDEPWLCHVPRRCGWACTPDVDCLAGGLYGPTRGGGLLLLLLFGGVIAFFACFYHPDTDLEYIPAERTYVPAKSKYRRGLEAYPIR